MKPQIKCPHCNEVFPIEDSLKHEAEELRKNGIIANIHYIPVHRQPFYEKLGFKLGDFPEAERFHREVLTLPMFPDLSTVEQNKVIKVLVESLKYTN